MTNSSHYRSGVWHSTAMYMLHYCFVHVFSYQLKRVCITVEINCNKNKRNIVIGCIYKHPSMELNDFNENLLDPLMEELSAKDKSVSYG